MPQAARTPTGEAGAANESAEKSYSDELDPKKVLACFNSHFKASKQHYADWRQEARDLYDVKAGRQWDPADEARLKEECRPYVTFNVADKYADVMQGLQINNRQDIRFYPREMGDAQVSSLMTGAVTWGRDLCDAADEETDAFMDAMWTGMGACDGYLDKDLHPGGVPACERIDVISELYPDNRAKKRNFADGRFSIRLKPLDDDQYDDLFGSEFTGDRDSEADFSSEFEDDGHMEIIDREQDYKQSSVGTDTASTKKKRIVADYQWWKREKRWLLRHPQQGERELTEREYDAYKEFFQRAQANGQQFSLEQITRKVYYRAWICNGTVATGENGIGLSPYQGGFTHHVITGKRDRNKNTWYGIGRSILDPQKWLNKFFSTLMHCMASNAKGGLMAEEGAFKDSRKAEAEWANPNAITWMKKGALLNGMVQPKPAAVYPQGLDRMMEFTLNSLPQTTGLNVELMGLSDRVQAGVVEAQRKQSAMAIVAWAFDSMRRYYRSMGRQMARYVIEYMPEGTLVMINGETSKQYVPLVKKRLSADFDIIVDEAPTSVNQQERVWAVLETMIPQLLQAGIKVTPKVLDYSPLPPDLVADWKKMLQPDPKVQQFEEDSAKAGLAKTQSEAQKNQAAAQLDQASAQLKMVEATTEGVRPQDVSAAAALKQMQAVKTAAEAGAAQAGGSPNRAA
jgi:hypothetical protein